MRDSAVGGLIRGHDAVPLLDAQQYDYNQWPKDGASRSAISSLLKSSLQEAGTDILSQAYSPMTIRFFILQAHYRGTVDFSNEALQAAEKAYERMLDGWKRLNELVPSAESTVHVSDLREKCNEAMNDDLNTPIVIAQPF